MSRGRQLSPRPTSASVAPRRKAPHEKAAPATPGAPALARDSAEPLYRQLAARLHQGMAAGTTAPGARLGSEAELMARFGVSRVTVRQALALLRERGTIVARRGKGTFAAERVVQHDLDALQGFYDALRQQGIEPETTLLEFSADAGALDPDRPAALALPVRLRRLYAVDGRPFALVVGYLPGEAAPLGRARAERLTVYQIIEQFLGRRVARAEVTIRCAPVAAEVARPLALKAGTPALVMERTSFADDGRACEFMRIHIIAERYEFRLKVSGALEIARSLHRAAPAVPTRASTR